MVRTGRYIVQLIMIFMLMLLLDLDLKAQNSSSYISSVAWSPDGNEIAVGYGTSRCDSEHPEYYNIQILNARTRQITQTLIGSQCSITSLNWNVDGNTLVASSVDSIGVRIWDVQTGNLLTTAQNIARGATSAMFSPDGIQLAASTTSNAVVIIDISTGNNLIGGLIGGTSIDWSPNSSKLVSGNVYENLTHVVDVVTGSELLTLPGNSPGSVAWSPDGTKLASGGGIDDTTIHIWDAMSGQPLLILQGHTSSITGVQWSPDSSFLASASHDGTMRVWDTSTGTEIINYQYPGRVNTVSWSPDGNQLVYGGERNDGQPSNIEIVTVPQTTHCDITSLFTSNNAGTPDSICLENSNYFSDISCNSSCWLGIEPYITTESELQNILDDANLQWIRNELGLSGTVVTYGVSTTGLPSPIAPESEIVIFIGEEMVLALIIPVVLLPVSAIIQGYGYPTHIVEAEHTFTLVYLEQEIAFISHISHPEYVFQVEIRTSDSLNSWYLNDSYFSAVILCDDLMQPCGIPTATPVP